MEKTSREIAIRNGKTEITINEQAISVIATKIEIKASRGRNSTK